MSERSYQDALTGDELVLDELTGSLSMRSQGAYPTAATSLFYPGCSLINYGAPLVGAVYDTLVEAGAVDGISFLCCGRILQLEEGDPARFDNFAAKLRALITSSAVERIVCGCPNCLQALRDVLGADGREGFPQLVALPQEFARLGYRIDEDIARSLVGKSGQEPVLLCPRDSCPDRELNSFARGVRELLPESIVVEGAHRLRTSRCCGASLRASGHYEAADRLARASVAEAQEVQADAMVASCLSCARQLSRVSGGLPVFHYLELLYAWPIDWSRRSDWMTTRLLLGEDETASVDALEQDAASDGEVIR